jgi:uncharacterized cupin superfamily protein
MILVGNFEMGIWGKTFGKYKWMKMAEESFVIRVA